MPWPAKLKDNTRLQILSWIDPRSWRQIFRLRRRREQTKWMEPPYRWQ